MSTAILSIGSNLGDRLANLQSAVDAFGPHLVSVSPVYETAPWGVGGVDGQPDYLNAILIVADPTACARDWLVRAQAAEDAAGRERNVRWSARTLDVDVISVDTERSDDETLTLPHPRAAQRAFVLVPWLAVDASAELPGVGRAASLLNALPSDEVAGIRPRPDLVLE